MERFSIIDIAWFDYYGNSEKDIQQKETVENYYSVKDNSKESIELLKRVGLDFKELSQNGKNEIKGVIYIRRIGLKGEILNILDTILQKDSRIKVGLITYKINN